MKKILLIPLMILLFVSMVSAGYVEDYFGIKWKKDIVANQVLAEENLCLGDYMFQYEIATANRQSLFIEALDAFDEGYHVIHIREFKYEDTDYFTAKIDSGKLHSIRKGICVNGEDYKYYYTDLTPEKIRSLVNNIEEKPIDIFKSLFTAIKGVNMYQKFHVIQVAIKAAIQYGL